MFHLCTVCLRKSILLVYELHSALKVTEILEMYVSFETVNGDRADTVRFLLS